MGDEREGVHLLPIEEHIHLDQLAGPVSLHLVVQRGIALGVGLEGVKEIIDDLVEGHGVVELHQIRVQILHVFELRPALLAHGHDVPHIVGGRDDGHLGKGLPRLLNVGWVGVVVGIVHLYHGAVGLSDLIDHRGQSGHQIQVELPLQPLLDDLHVEHAQKAAAEAEAQGGGGLRLKGERGVVELELFQRVPQIGVLGAVLGIHAAVHHGLGGPVAGQGLGGGTLHAGDGVAHPGVLHILDGRGEIAHLAGRQTSGGLQPQGPQAAALNDFVGGPRGHHLDLHPGADGALHDPEIDDDPPVGVILAVKDQGLEGGLRIALGRGNVVDDVLQHRVDVEPHLGRDLGRVHGGQADDVLDLMLDLLGVGGGQIDLVHHRADLQVVLQGQIGVGQGLGLDALGGVHHQDGALTGRQRAGDLVVEVHMARGVDEVELILLPVLSPVIELDRPGLDGDAPLPLQVHVVQQLALHLPLGDGVALLDQPVGEGGFAMVDMGDDTEIADLALVAHMQKPPSKSPHGSLDPAACIRIRPDAQPVWRENTGLPDMSKRPMRCFVRLILSFSAPARKR